MGKHSFRWERRARDSPLPEKSGVGRGAELDETRFSAIPTAPSGPSDDWQMRNRRANPTGRNLAQPLVSGARLRTIPGRILNRGAQSRTRRAPTFTGALPADHANGTRPGPLHSPADWPTDGAIDNCGGPPQWRSTAWKH